MNKWDYVKFKKLLHSKENHQWNEKAVYRMGENICKSFIWQGINIKMYEESVQPNNNIDNNNKIANNPIKRWMEEPNSFPEKTDRWQTHRE